MRSKPLILHWTVAASLLKARHALVAASANGRIYAIGGAESCIDGFDRDSNLIEEYNPVTDKWTIKKGLVGPVAYHAAASLGGKIYITGGSSMQDVFISYEPATETGRQLPTRTTKSWQNTASIVNVTHSTSVQEHPSDIAYGL